MNMNEAKTAATAFITPRKAAEWAMLDTDHMLWVEDNIMAPAGIQSSICTDFGAAICEWIEIKLEAQHISNMLAD